MPKGPPAPPSEHYPPLSRPSRVGLALVGLASLALMAAACGGGQPSASPTTATAGSGVSNTGTGVVTRPGSGSGSQSSGNRSTGTYTLAFAECMRVHGVPNFPNPNGKGSQLGPGSGIDPTSPAFQAALNGPCQSLAPPGWVSSGPVTR